MKPFQKILGPTDFSAHALEATRVAADLSRRYAASLTLVYVYEPVNYAVPEGYILYTSSQLERMFAEFEQRLVEARRDAETAGASRVDTRLLQGLVASEITDFAFEGGFDLVVMGTHGRTGIKHLLMGSVAERVLRRAPCPVLTVRLPKGT